MTSYRGSDKISVEPVANQVLMFCSVRVPELVARVCMMCSFEFP